MKIPPLVSVQWLSKNIDHKNLVILDASPKSNVSNLIPEFTDIQIKGARLFDMKNVFFDKESELPNMMPSPEVFTRECQKLGIHKDSVLVVYDNLGIYTSPRVWWMFKAMGHDAVTVLDGGLSAWKNANYEFETIRKPIIEKGNFEANYQPNLVRDANFILNNCATKKALVIDARSEGRFKGTLPEPRKNMQSGHIPNSLNLPFKQVLDKGKMKSKKELIQLFKKLNIGNQELVFTCGSGITACVILLAFEIVVNNKKSLYDGSWAEWGMGQKFPVETT